MSTSEDIRRLWVNGSEVKEVDNEDGEDEGDITSSLVFYHDASGNVLYYYSATNPASTFSSMEQNEWDDYALGANNQSYWTIDEIDFRGANYCVRINGGHNIKFTDCAIGYNSFYGLRFYAQSATYTALDTMSVIDCDLNSGNVLWYTTHNDQNTEDGLQVSGPMDSLIVSGCTFTNWAHDGFNLYPSLPDTADMAKDIYVFDNEFTAPDITYGRAIDLQSVVTGSENINVFRNYIHDMPTGSQLISSYTNFYNNIIDNIRGDVYGLMSAYAVEGMGLGLSPYRGSPVYSNWIHNNLIIRCAEWAIDIRTRDEVPYAPIYYNFFWNNILAFSHFDETGYTAFHYNTGAHEQIRIFDDGNNNTLVKNSYRNNNFYDTSATSGTELIFYYESGGDYELTVTQFNALDQTYAGDTIQNNVDGNPGFEDPDNADYRITTGAAADGGGTNIDNYDYDYFEQSVSSPPNIGPIEESLVAMRFVPDAMKIEYLAIIHKARNK